MSEPALVRRERALAGLLIALTLVPLVHLACVLIRSHLDVPLWDEWELVPLLERARAGTLSVGDLWAQHNEHRIFFPRVWMLALARVTDYSIGVELAANVVVAGALASLLGWKAARAVSGARAPWGWAALPAISLLTFSLAQWENWITGWQIQIWLPVLTYAAAAFVLLSGEFRWKNLAFAYACAAVATCSFADGVLAWPAIFLAILYAFPRRESRRAAIVWLAAGAGVIALYLAGYHAVPDHPSPLATLAHPLRLGEYVLRFLGGPLASRDRGLQMALGALGLALPIGAALVLERRGVARPTLAPWLALALEALACAALAGLGRAGFGEGYGPNQARAPRYVTLASPLWVADVVLLLLLAATAPVGRERRARLARFAPAAGFVAIVALGAVNSIRGARDLRETVEGLRPARDAVVLGDVATVETRTILELLPRDRADAALLRERVATLRRLGLGPFRR